MIQYAPPGGLMPAGTLPSAGVPIGPHRRDPLKTWLLPFVDRSSGGIIFGRILMLLSLALGSLALFILVLGGMAWYGLLAFQMANEVKAVTRNPAFVLWPMVVPFYSLYWAWLLVPQEVARAKQMMGIQAPTRPIVLYIFLWHFALASDVNDLVR